MAEGALDPTGFYDLDVRRGQLSARGEGPVVVLPRALARELLGDADALRRLGERLGERVAQALERDPAGATPEAVAGRVADVLGVHGFGRPVFERWGEALAVRWADPPLGPEAGAALLGALLGALSGRPVGCVPLADDRHLVLDPEVAATVRRWARDQPLDVAAAVARLAAPSEGARA